MLEGTCLPKWSRRFDVAARVGHDHMSNADTISAGVVVSYRKLTLSKIAVQ